MSAAGVVQTAAQEVIQLSKMSTHTEAPKEAERYENGRIEHITQGSVTIFPADSAKNSGRALLICPGGGYRIEAIDHEGYDVARWLASEGITGVVLKYRLPYGVKEIPLEDAQEALQLVRSRAEQWGVNPNQVGICGFSAGGHLASTVGTHFESETRPDFMVLFYPVISMMPVVGHQGSRENLMGKSPDPTTLEAYSNATRVTSDTPPTLLLLSDDDKAVIPQNSIEFYSALKQSEVSASMHIFPSGGHGWGFRSSFAYHEEMKALLLKWMNQLK